MKNKTMVSPQFPLLGGLAALALLLFTPGNVHAQATVLFACYVPNSGVVYRVNPPLSPGENSDLKDACTGKKHVLFDWNQQGPPGANGSNGTNGTNGTNGVSGWQRKFQNFNIGSLAPGLHAQHDLDCPAGKKLLGGGFVGAGRFLFPAINFALDDDTWRVRLVNSSPNTETGLGMRITILCADV